MSNQLIDLDEIKQIIESLPKATYTSVHILVSRFSHSDNIGVHYSVSVSPFTSTLAPTLEEALRQYEDYKTNTRDLEEKLASATNQVEELRAEIARRKAAQTEHKVAQ